MKDISSTAHDSILHDTVEAVKHFSWKTVGIELHDKLLTLMTLLAKITKKSASNSSLLCLLGSMILKWRHRQMGLVQHAISVMMYMGMAHPNRCIFKHRHILLFYADYAKTFLFAGVFEHATAQYLYVLQAISPILKEISEHHDIEVQIWADKMIEATTPQHHVVSHTM